VPQDWQVRICNITLGEIEFGHLIANPPDIEKQEDFNRFLNQNFIRTALEVSTATRIDYAEILARILEAHPRPNQDIRMEWHLAKIGVDMNDLWTVAVAREHNLTFVTQDKMSCIREACFDVLFDCWL
jgi:predicted nucleic acid-binding protein